MVIIQVQYPVSGIALNVALRTPDNIITSDMTHNSQRLSIVYCVSVKQKIGMILPIHYVLPCRLIYQMRRNRANKSVPFVYMCERETIASAYDNRIERKRNQEIVAYNNLLLRICLKRISLNIEYNHFASIQQKLKGLYLLRSVSHRNSYINSLNISI